MVKCQGQKVYYQQSSTHCSKVISKVIISKKWVKHKGQGHRVKTLALTVQKLLAIKVKVSERRTE